ncbi:MAG TPA: ABC transporter ATP-binding protein [Trueperaceae bacterium]|nr:ABC transporter ATP-binding protein [Trueperaceae bacterium]
MADHPGPDEWRGRVSLRGLTKRYGSVTAVDGLDLEVTPASFTTLLGPSGCGKTTALRMIAGFVEPDAGSVSVGGRDVTFVPPDKRGVGMVFQDYALFPHLSVRRNVEYGLRARQVPASQRRERVDRTLAALDLSGLGDRYPHQLSGGQQQRVALGRVMVLEPQVLLLDEPLSNLDAQLRARLRSELKELQRRLGVTAIYVTHDQEEALSLSDRVVVMDAGRVQQVGSSEDVYRLPATAFVARFVGQANMLPVTAVGPGTEGQVRAKWDGGELDLRLPDDRVPEPGSKGFAVMRPERVGLRAAASEDAGDRPVMSGTVVGIEYFGAYRRFQVLIEGPEERWLADVPDGSGPGFANGDKVSIELAGEPSWAW